MVERGIEKFFKKSVDKVWILWYYIGVKAKEPNKYKGGHENDKQDSRDWKRNSGVKRKTRKRGFWASKEVL